MIKFLLSLLGVEIETEVTRTPEFERRMKVAAFSSEDRRIAREWMGGR